VERLVHCVKANLKLVAESWWAHHFFHHSAILYIYIIYIYILFIYLSIYLSIHPSIHPSIYHVPSFFPFFPSFQPSVGNGTTLPHLRDLRGQLRPSLGSNPVGSPGYRKIMVKICRLIAG
jgi:hypothetical protein